VSDRMTYPVQGPPPSGGYGMPPGGAGAPPPGGFGGPPPAYGGGAPGFGGPPPAYGGPPGGYGQMPGQGGSKNATMATVSLVLGILSLFCCVGVSGIPAIITGVMARNEIARDPSLGGQGLATAGIILGSISILLTLGYLAFFGFASVMRFF